MDIKMETSFIPKRPMIDNQGFKPKINLFFIFSIIIFVISLVLALGVWFRQDYLIKQIKKDRIDLLEAKKKYSDEDINNLIRLDDRLSVSKNLLNNHLSLNPIFFLLEENILKKVRVNSLSISHDLENRLKMDLSGIASNYEVLLKQSELFKQEELAKIFTEIVISDIGPVEVGGVSFRLTGFVNTDILLYKNTIADSNNSSFINDLIISVQ